MSLFLLMKEQELTVFLLASRMWATVSNFGLFADLFFIACYFGALMQVLFHLPNIQHKLLTFRESESFDHLKDIDDSEMNKAEKAKLKASKELIKHIQRLFAAMLLANVKYQDPTQVLESIVDDNARKIPIYE